MHIGASESNCFIRISFDTNCQNDILCTPSQELYSIQRNRFISACKLRAGDRLLSLYNDSVTVHAITLMQKPLKVYALEVAHDHTYIVGNYGIVAHNMVLPELISVGTIVAPTITSGAVIGGCFCPVTLVGGIALGAAVGCIIKCFVDNTRTYYQLHFDIDTIAQQLKDGTLNKEAESVKEKFDNLGGLTNDEARRKAKEWGYAETKEGRFNAHGKPKFKKGNSIITPDRDAHNGGVWKEFDRKNRRIGTLDKNGNRIKD